MVEHDAVAFLRELLVFLAAAGILIPLAHRLRINPVLGYLLIGLAIGPYGLGRLAADWPALAAFSITRVDDARLLAEFGVVFLLFTIGLEFSFDRLWALRRLVFGLGGAQVMVTALAIAAIALAFGNDGNVALILGLCLALSSTAIVTQLLIDRGALGSPTGQTIFAVLLFQDLAVVPILFLVGVLGNPSDGGAGLAFALAIAKATGAILLILVIGRLALRPLLSRAGATRRSDMMMAVTLLAVLGTAALTAAAGLSMALGAFLAGLLISETEFRHAVEVALDPFKGLLLGLFFMTVGFGIDLVGLLPLLPMVIASALGLLLLKGSLAWGLAMMARRPLSQAVTIGALLAQGGEFAFVVIGLALSLSVIAAETGQFMLAVVTVTMMATPGVAGLGYRLAARFETGQQGIGLTAEAPSQGHVLIAGFGRVGRAIARALDRQGIPYLALDLDVASVGEARTAGRSVIYGDASQTELLRRCNVRSAAAIVLTMDSPSATQRAVEAIHRAWPHLPILARARDRVHAETLRRLGASVVVEETVEAGLRLAESALTVLGVPEDVAQSITERERGALT